MNLHDGYFYKDGTYSKLSNPVIFETKIYNINGIIYNVDINQKGEIIRAYKISDGTYCVPNGYRLEDKVGIKLEEIKNSTSPRIFISSNELRNIIDLMDITQEIVENEDNTLILK